MSFTIIDSILFKKGIDKKNVALPHESKSKTIMSKVHVGNVGGNLGAESTIHKIVYS